MKKRPEPPAEAFHPGTFIKEELEARDWSQKELAWMIGYNRVHVAMVCNEHRPVGPEMAVRLAIAFDVSPEFFLRLQAAYDIGQLRKKYGRTFAKVKMKSRPVPKLRWQRL